MDILNQPEPIHRLLALPARMWAVLLALVAAASLSGCSTTRPAAAPAPQAATPPASSAAAPTTVPTQINIYTPATTTSVPIILAAREMTARPVDGETVKLTVFSNHSQANTLFLRGDVDILVTGLSVGLGLFKNGAPVQVINCNVSGLTYLVTYGRQVQSLRDLDGGSLYVPFEGSPIEETSRFFAQSEGLAWGQDIKPVYAASDSALALLRQGKALAVALPEPFVSLAEQDPQVHVSFSYRDKWNALTGSTGGYPQVCAFGRKDWLAGHKQTVDRFNDEIAKAIETVERDPAGAALQTEAALGLTQKILQAGLARTTFYLRKSGEMAQDIRKYYEVVGKALDTSYDSFFYGE